MKVQLTITEPFTSPAWGSNFVVFTDSSGQIVSEKNAREYLAKSSDYAMKFGVYLVPERFMVDGGQSLCLIDPKGKVIEAQKEIASGDFIHDYRLSPLRTPFGKLILLVGDDVFYPEIVRVAFNMGARLIIASQTISALSEGNHSIVSGVWNASQSNNLFTIGASNFFKTVCAPLDLTQHKDGFTLPPTSKPSVSVQFELSELKKLSDRSKLSEGFYHANRMSLIGDQRELITKQRVSL